MEEELNENELEERFYSMLHYVDDTQANVTTTQNNVNIFESTPRSTVRRYWRPENTSPPDYINTSFKKVNIRHDTPKPIDNPKPKEERSKVPDEPLPKHLALFQSAVPLNVKQKIEILDHDDDKIVELITSDEDEVVEVTLPPKPTITIESSDEDELTLQVTPTKGKIDVQEKGNNSGDREVSASPVPSVVSSLSDEYIRGDCIALNISSHCPENPSFDFSLHGSDLLDSIPSKKKKRKKNKGNDSSPPIAQASTPEKIHVEACFATPKSKAKKKKQKKNTSKELYTVTECSVPNADVYDSDSNQSIIELNKSKSSFVVSEKSIPCADVYETDSNETAKEADKSNSTQNESENNIITDKPNDGASTCVDEKSTCKTPTPQAPEPMTIDLTDIEDINIKTVEIAESIVIGNVSGLEEPKDCKDQQNAPVIDQPVTTDSVNFGSTKVPAILYENLDFDNLKGKDKVCKSRRYSLTTLRAEMDKFYNESWGGEDFNHREIQKNMSRDKSLWAIDPKDRMPTLGRKKYSIICNYCNRPGHRDDTCRSKPPVCYMCGNVGHVEPRCPSKICVNCGSPNFMYSTMCRNCVAWGRVMCPECGQAGHPATHCPDMWRRYHNTTEVTMKLSPGGVPKRPCQRFCSGCTRRGHLVHDCRFTLPFSGLPVNSPYVHMYRPIFYPIHYPLPQSTQFTPIQPTTQDPTSPDPVKTQANPNKRQSKSPTAHETHVNKKRNTSDTDKSISESPAPPDHQRKRSLSKEPVEQLEAPTEQETPLAVVPEAPEKAPDFIPIFSNNRDKQGQVIQDNEVSDTSDVVTAARICILGEVVEKLKTDEGQTWLKETVEKSNLVVEDEEITSFLTIKGKVADQESFQVALREWSKTQKEANISQQTDDVESFLTNNIPKNRHNVLRKINKALHSLKKDLGEPNAMFKELNYLQNRHEQLMKMKVINPKQLDNSRENINDMLKRLNMILLGQAGLAGGSKHLKQLYVLQHKLLNYRQKTLSVDLRKEIGEHFQSIFTATPRDDYTELLNSFNSKQLTFTKKSKNFNLNPKMKKLNTIPTKNPQINLSPAKVMKAAINKKNAASDDQPPRPPLVEKTLNKLVFYHRRLVKARPNDAVLKKTRIELVRKLHSLISTLTNSTNTTKRRLKKMRKVQEQAQVFLSNV